MRLRSPTFLPERCNNQNLPEFRIKSICGGRVSREAETMAKIHIGWWAASACAGLLVVCGAVLLGMMRERLCILLGHPPEPFIGRDRMRPGGRMQLLEAGIGEKRWVGLADHPGGPGAWIELRLLARAEGYVMVRADGHAPTVMEEAEWDKLPMVLRSVRAEKGRPTAQGSQESATPE
jgi:hypothetical protein